MHANKIDKTKLCRGKQARHRKRAKAKKNTPPNNREHQHHEREVKWKNPSAKCECEIKALPHHIKYAFFHFSRKPDVQPLVARANFSLFVCSHHIASIIYETLFTPRFRSMSCILHMYIRNVMVGELLLLCFFFCSLSISLSLYLDILQLLLLFVSLLFQ